MRKALGALLLAALAVTALLYFFPSGGSSDRPEVNAARATRMRLVSTIVTNGRIEPAGYSAVRARRAGAVVRIAVTKGQRVAAGQPLAELDASAFAPQIDAASARLAQAQAELKVIDQGGDRPALTSADNEIAALDASLAVSRRERDQIARLVEKQAETKAALTAASDRVAQLEAQREALRRSRAALAPAGNRAAVEARIREAESARQAAESEAQASRLTAPSAGVVYSLPLRPGAFVQPGDLIAEIGQAGSAVAIVYVDEPELGRVAPGMPVKITWDAMPDKSWQAMAERMPTQIVALNSRQVGELVCKLDDTEGRLPPGANINAEIVSRDLPAALAVPKAALRREGGVPGVLAIEQPSGKLLWRPVRLGVASITHVEIAAGLTEGELVALPGPNAFAAGDVVRVGAVHEKR